jgi:dTDP-4-dehydrorhamnose reductase
VYISTNEVFDGGARKPYLEFDVPNPINPYGYSKWVGEQVVQQLVPCFYIVRVAWVFGGARNFVRTILRLAQERNELAVVDDEVGNPTYAPDLAEAIARLINHPAYGIYHLVNDGFCSRFEFAREILQQAGMENVAIKPIKLADYRRDSTPPAFGVLRNFVGATDLGIQLRPWQAALAAFLESESHNREQ